MTTRLARLFTPLLATTAVLAAASLPAQAQQLAGTLQKLKEKGVIVMGTRDSSAPLAFTLGGGQYTGYHVELCQKVIDSIKAKIGSPAL